MIPERMMTDTAFAFLADEASGLTIEYVLIAVPGSDY
jgi:hypothetical protein